MQREPLSRWRYRKREHVRKRGLRGPIAWLRAPRDAGRRSSRRASFHTWRFRKSVVEADPVMALETLRNAAFSAFLVGQQAARLMLGNELDANGAKGTIIFTNASAALKGFPSSGAFAMACHAKSGLAQSMAREMMPQGIHIVNVPIDAAIGWTQEDGTRAHRVAGTTVDDNMADPDCIAETYLQLHRQHRSTWAFEVVLRPWVETW
jgi:NAD(P)-dependent dehydrogenase (short-subunit alcohol dehydrogenase family)